jgi:hypothetical protein
MCCGALVLEVRAACRWWSRSAIGAPTSESEPIIEHLNDLPSHVVGFVCSGRITRRDYETVLVPVIEAALQQHEKVRLYYQIGLDLSHIEPGVSHNFDVGIDRLLRWDRIGIVTDRFARRFALSFLMPGYVELLSLDEAAEAREWLLA